MHIEHLSLTNFRTYARLEIDLQARIHMFQGANAQGKTNLLEAIYYLATTKSPLTSSDRELIHWQAEEEVIPFARVEGVFQRGESRHTIEITLVTERDAANSQGTASFKRQIRFNGVNRRAMDILGQVNEVLFLPEDTVLVSGSPSDRRRYLDVMLCQLSPVYCRKLSHYGRIISQRNALLRRVREGKARVGELSYWDERAAELGGYVLCQRQWAVSELNKHVQEIHPSLTGGDELLTVVYESSLAERSSLALADSPRNGQGRPQEEQVQTISQVLCQTLQSVRREELARGVTTVGPHRDDLHFLLNGRDATVYGSRGQQRTIALALKIGEMLLMHAETGEMPILLLDDVLSELDDRRGQFLLDAVSRAEQVLITATDLHGYPRGFLDSVVLWQVSAGRIFQPG